MVSCVGERRISAKSVTFPSQTAGTQLFHYFSGELHTYAQTVWLIVTEFVVVSHVGKGNTVKYVPAIQGALAPRNFLDPERMSCVCFCVKLTPCNLSLWSAWVITESMLYGSPHLASNCNYCCVQAYVFWLVVDAKSDTFNSVWYDVVQPNYWRWSNCNEIVINMFTRLSYVCLTFLCVLLDCSYFVYFYVYFMYLLVSMCVWHVLNKHNSTQLKLSAR